MYTVGLYKQLPENINVSHFQYHQRTELRKGEIFADTLYKHMFTSCSIGNVYNITF